VSNSAKGVASISEKPMKLRKQLTYVFFQKIRAIAQTVFLKSGTAV